MTPALIIDIYKDYNKWEGSVKIFVKLFEKEIYINCLRGNIRYILPYWHLDTPPGAL